MSIKLMMLAWESSYPTGKKMVLLALCDNANEQGECYPSVATLMAKCSISERSMFNHLDSLERDGALKRLNRTGRSTIYQLNSSCFCTSATPATVAPTPATVAPPVPATVAPITTIEPSKEPSLNQNTVQKVFGLVDVDQEILDDFLKIRKAKKAPLTKTAVTELRREAEKAGLSLNDVLTMCCVRGWVGFQADWIAGRQSASQPGKGAGTGSGETAYQRSMRERVAEFSPSIARRVPGETPLQTFTFEVENVPALARR